MTYSYIRTLTIRGSKIKKIMKILKDYEMFFGQSHVPLKDIDNENIKKENSIKYYAVNECIRDIKYLINKTFDKDNYEKSEFKKKAFSGSKIVSILNYIDHQLEQAQLSLSMINFEKELSDDGISLTFKMYLEQRLESLKLIKSIILSQYVELREEEMDFVQTILINLSKDY